MQKIILIVAIYLFHCVEVDHVALDSSQQDVSFIGTTGFTESLVLTFLTLMILF